MNGSLFEASDREPARVLIAGGGVAAQECLRALRALAPKRLAVELLAPRTEFDQLTREHGVRLHPGTLAAVDVHRRLVRTAEGQIIGYDALLVAVGATSRPALAGALTFRSARDIETVLEDAANGVVRSIAFAVPPAARWALPLYELALTTAARAAALQLELRIELVTYERAPLALFGPRTSDEVRTLLTDAGIRVRTRTRALVAQPGRLFIAGGAIAADRVVAAGRLAVAPIEGLPQRHHGFIPVDPDMRVEGAPRVYAAGDATWYPNKQGGIAAQQGETAAASIAADAGLLRENTDSERGMPPMPLSRFARSIS